MNRIRTGAWSFLLVVLFNACHTTPGRTGASGFIAGYRISPDWAVTDSLMACESVIYDAVSNCFYVSNSPEYAFSGKGYLSKLSPAGELVEAKWIQGLNRPTGMAIKGRKLYVGDMDRLVEIDIPTARVTRQYQAGEGGFPGINDVSVSPSGELFVSGAAVHSIFKMENDELKVWLQDTTKLRWANGILAMEDRLIVAGWELSSVDYRTREIKKLSTSPDLIDMDGLEADGKGGFFISSAGSGINTIWHVDADGRGKVLLRRELYTADFDYLPRQGKLVAASGNNDKGLYTVVSYRVKEMGTEN